MLTIDRITLRAGPRTLLGSASASLPAGARAALVGPNGSGKTTLLRAIAGEIPLDGGRIEVPNAWQVARLKQEAPGGDSNLLDTVMAADHTLAELNRRAETESDPAALAEIHEQLRARGAAGAEAKAARILAGLGFDSVAQQRPCSSFSGGWRMRVALAGLLFTEPELLLLDEPTNHLDLESTLWLEDYLSRYPGTVLLVSHERRLLNRVASQIVHVYGGQLTAYSGNYDRFAQLWQEKRAQQAAHAREQEKERQRIQRFIDRFRANANRAKQAQSKIKMLERMETVAQPVDAASYPITFPEPQVPPPPLLTLDNAAAGYDGQAVLADLSLRVDPEDRIALLGPNGAGKSTLAKLLAGHLQPLSGDRVAAKGLRVGYFAQHQTDLLRADWRPIDHIAEVLPSLKPAQQRARLGKVGLVQAKAETPVRDLSGGEKARLLFALMAAAEPNLLILDEPTNHLDIDGRDHLVKALNDFPGAVVLISHDAHLIELSADRLLRVGEGRVESFDGDMGDYQKLLLQANKAAASGEAAPESAGKSEGDKAKNKAKGKEARKAKAEARAKEQPLRQKLKKLEKELARLVARKKELEATMAEPDFYSRDSATISQVQTELDQTAAQIAETEEAWLAAAEELEAYRQAG